jgi:hypothetical protein
VTSAHFTAFRAHPQAQSARFCAFFSSPSRYDACRLPLVACRV